MNSLSPTFPEKRPFILLLEDSPNDAQLILFELERGETASERKWVASRVEFEAALRERLPDLVLSDNHLPDFSGMEALELTRQKSSLIPFIVITGALGDEAAITFLQAGATDYILKDRLYRLNPAVTRALREANERNEARRGEKQSKVFAKLSHQLSATATPLEAANIILEVADELLGWDAACLNLTSRDGEQMQGLLTIDTRDGKRVVIDEEPGLMLTPMMREVLLGRPCLVDPSTGFASEIPLVPFGSAEQKSQSKMYVPIDSAGKVLGILSIQSYTAGAYSPEELSLLQTLADHCGDALRRIEMTEALRKTEAKYHSIFENATEGIFQTTPRGKYLSANPALARMFGYDTPEELMAGVSDIERQTYVLPEKREEFKRIIAEYGSIEQFEVERYRRDRTTFWISINAHAVRDSLGQVVYYEGTNQDISERKRAEVVLRDSEERFRALFESAPIGIALHDSLGHYVKVNEAYQRMLGYNEEELKLLGPRRVTHPDDVAPAALFLKEMQQGKRNRYERDKRFLRKDQKVVWAHSSGSSLRDRAGNLRFTISMVEDITERKMLEQEVLETSSNERRRVGHELHDGLGQYLAGIAFKAKALEQDLIAQSIAFSKDAGEISDLVSNAIRQTRNLARGFDPIEVETIGLPAALQNLAAETKDFFGVDCQLRAVNPAISLDPQSALSLYRIAQESIHNSIKHGASKSIFIDLLGDSFSVSLRVRDDGLGFDPLQERELGMGLRVMGYRARAMRGELSIKSQPGEGTEILCRIPSLKPEMIPTSSPPGIGAE